MALIKWRRFRGWCLSAFDELWTMDGSSQVRTHARLLVLMQGTTEGLKAGDLGSGGSGGKEMNEDECLPPSPFL